jgi:hypothetical protein
MSTHNTFQIVATNLSQALLPLKEAVSTLSAFQSYTRKLGWEPTNIPMEYTDLVMDVDSLITELDNLSGSPSIADIENLLQKVKDIYENAQAISVAPTNVNASDFLGEFADDIFRDLMITHLNNYFSGLLRFLESINVVEYLEHDEETGRTDYIETKINFNRLSDFISNPIALLKSYYQWGTTAFDYEGFIGILREFLIARGISAYTQTLSNEQGPMFSTIPLLLNRSDKVLKIPLCQVIISNTVHEIGFEIEPLHFDFATGGPGFIIKPVIPSQLANLVQLTDKLTLELRADTEIATMFGLLVGVNGLAVRYPFQNAATLPQAGFGATLKYLITYLQIMKLN